MAVSKIGYIHDLYSSINPGYQKMRQIITPSTKIHTYNMKDSQSIKCSTPRLSQKTSNKFHFSSLNITKRYFNLECAIDFTELMGFYLMYQMEKGHSDKTISRKDYGMKSYRDIIRYIHIAYWKVAHKEQFLWSLFQALTTYLKVQKLVLV